MKPRSITLTVNGAKRTAAAEPRVTLLDFLRGPLGVTGAHMGCEHGVCGACSVLVEGEPVRACLMFAVQAAGKAVTTVEGLAGSDGEPSPLQEAFRDAHGLQCGYCTPGMLIAAQALLDENPDPDEADIREAIGGNICRCTGYVQIIEAIKLAAENLREAAQ
ncbi:MAG: (2Fe-2S)-binding protein [Rhodospirillaceae bacterium]|jgi:carbon-monoxide dehydrogenase small subunit|nr:(2Fe-2S)-binding protein [Rhodospirillaceae bacterium]MBT3883568.1 (2Fe-2S)-binding protein [Rhodospirillaceae bacterium]MBT4116614.1 (2Fe-2S)-binding protein [Rhodospirillaceae bacterium]MBT4670954.1 (2Fe-2S)-binding protein [Rhodospirillaceae bacterium]MBT4718584.1 (2Fe-2S)-binding protein [Rhodospirillaceae bacterium]